MDKFDVSKCRVILEDSIMQKGCVASAGSKMLENFIAPFDAEVVTRLRAAGVENIEQVKSEKEFSIDGGKMSEAVAAVAEGRADFALCNDFWSFNVTDDLYYIRPTYGTVSRYGLIPAVSSMDQVGIICKNPVEGFNLLSVIAGYDPKDGAMFPEKSYEYKPYEGRLKIGMFGNMADRDIPGNYDIIKMEIKYPEISANMVMWVLSRAEISNNINRYDGIKFGYRANDFKGLEDLYVKSRTEGLGLEAKLAAITGCFVLSEEYYEKYYDKAMKIRRLIKESLDFSQYDVLVFKSHFVPGSALAPLAGLPSLSTPNGLRLIADVKNENKLLAAWEAIK